MPSVSRPSSARSNRQASIDKLDYRPGGRPLLRADERIQGASSSISRDSENHSYAGSFFEDVAEGIVARDREKLKREVIRYTSFIWANVNCLGAGSITTFSLYAPLFQSRLHYSQLQVNGVSIAAEVAMYLSVPLFGYLCDRWGPGIPSLLGAVLFGFGYLLAAFAYKNGPIPEAGGDGWPYWVMIIAFIAVGLGTACLMFASATTCAKNFGRGKYRGLALAMPIACFGLSGMWLSQVSSNLLYERLPNGVRGDLDVHRYFLFLGGLLLGLGTVGFFVLRIVGENELIEEAIEEMEQSGLLENSDYFHHAVQAHENGHGYGTLTNGEDSSIIEALNDIQSKAAEQRARQLEDKRNKTLLLNQETRRFLMDRSMWWLAAGFFLVTGPGEGFVNNLGTIIGTLYQPISTPESGNPTTAATHVSIFAITSTLGRILTGILTDVLAPTTTPHQHWKGPNSLVNSVTSLHQSVPRRRFEVSRITFLISFCILMSIGQVILASGLIQHHGERFWIVTVFIGLGYGALFSLTPITVSVIWGVENFGTNWGFLATVPALGATSWGLIYSAVYQWAAQFNAFSGFANGAEELCYGSLCYVPTFWGMAICVWIACGFWLWAWKGPGGWAQRGIAV